MVGAAGFVGGHLLRKIGAENGLRAVATKLPAESLNTSEECYDLDILQQNSIETILQAVKPEYIIHLAAQSSVSLSWRNPCLTVDINVKGVLNLLEAVRNTEITPKILLVGSGEEYGPVPPDAIPVSEDVCPHPGNLYAITKNTQNQIGALYAKAYGMDIISTRSFNHMGAGQSPQFVVADFCKQVADIEKGKQEPCIQVGNLAAKRDFTDVRDVVKAYCLLLEKGIGGHTYNVGSGCAVSIQEVLDTILALSDYSIQVQVDQSKFRPVDVPVIEADIARLKHDTGWKPQYRLADTLLWTLEYWRS